MPKSCRWSVHAVAVVLLVSGAASGSAEIREERHRMLDFLVGSWSTSHDVPSREGDKTTVLGNATIEWAVGNSWLRFEFHAEFPGRGDVHTANMMNYSPAKKMYNFYLFDHFGGEAGVFYGDWNAEEELVLKASFEEDDGTTSHQRFTLTRVSVPPVVVDQPPA